MSYDVYWVKNRAEKIADFEHPTRKATSSTLISNLLTLSVQTSPFCASLCFAF